jgi:hypothetical protein
MELILIIVVVLLAQSSRSSASIREVADAAFSAAKMQSVASFRDTASR